MIKKGRTILGWFTLIELLVAISIIAILAIGVSNINWNRLSDRQKITIFQNRVVSEIETIRNNALFGKAVTPALIVPHTWRIDLSAAGIDIDYSQLWDNNFEDYTDLILQPRETISAVYCWSDLSTPITGELIIQGADMHLLWDCNGEQILVLDLEYNESSSGSMQINVVNGLIGDRQ